MNLSSRRIGSIATLTVGYLAWLSGAGCVGSSNPDRTLPRNTSEAHMKISIKRTSHRGWRDAVVMSNGKVNVVIVPAIGRVMQFGFEGEESVFWENPDLGGQPALKGDWASTDWVNLGGDKSWPAPEAEWSKFTGRKGWRPPAAFDGLPSTAEIVDGVVVMTSQVDASYGIRVERRVHLDPGTTTMTIQTIYHRVSGEPARIGVWVITQLREPAGVFAPVPLDSKFPRGFTLLGEDTPPSLRSENGLVSLLRDPKSAFKIGLDGGSLLWVGTRHMLRIDSERQSGAEYPDKGSSTEIYTNPDPLRYVELETLGPLEYLKAGERIERSNTYTLLPRTRATPDEEAQAIYGR
jgi:hypothetical protein